MSKRLIILLAFFVVSSCGFKPLYSGKNQILLAAVQFSPKKNDIEHNSLKGELEDLFNPIGIKIDDDLYQLSFNVSKGVDKIVIKDRRTANRYNVTLTSNYVLNDNLGNQIVSDTAKIVSSYNRVDSEFALYQAEQDAINKAIPELAQKMKMQLLPYLSRP